MKTRILLFQVICIITIVSCDNYEPILPKNEEVLDGEMEGLTPAQLAEFLRGDEAFGDVFTSSEGLGPLFNTNSCISCHAGDGKGHPFTTLTRFGQSDNSGNQFLNMGGPQLQQRALPGYQPENIPNGATFSKFIPPAVTGLGFLQYVTDESIMYIHRFGKKAAAYDLLDQTVGAYNEDMGITSTFNPIDTHSGLSIDPEVSDNTIRDVVVYLQTLKAPVPRNQNDPKIINGKSLFNRINCASCHTPTLTTGYSPIEALSHKEFNPYTDLLLHDMGSNLDDGYTEGNALTSEWRTPPLWGLGLSKSTQGGQYFLLHDGRAGSISEAILLHGGEAENSKNQFVNLSENEKEDLIKFLESL